MLIFLLVELSTMIGIHIFGVEVHGSEYPKLMIMAQVKTIFKNFSDKLTKQFKHRNSFVNHIVHEGMSPLFYLVRSIVI